MLRPSTSATYDRVLELSAAGELELAIDELQQQLSHDSDNGRLWELLGVLAFAREDFALAQSATEEASVLIPLSARSQLVLGKCYDRAEHREAAATIYRNVAGIAELDVDLLEPLASGLGRYGMYELALHVCRQAAQRIPDSADLLMGIVHYLRRLRRPIEHILPTMFRVHHLEPENVEYRITLAWMLHEAGRSREGAYLLEVVDYECFSCPRCLRLITIIFEHVGDVDRVDQCRARLDRLGHGASLHPNQEVRDE